ncbi:CLUMA_CG018317, isoform A [Clunio marinus]|uniref:CLUMA_CG018317, isoform A n=1 Tax=Clunio marinus TaxID=568069 RepID=A0A1J1IY96_9DIPT|nr:CLUMA_CG018317, isoform A [Clunio marinus]
MLEGRENEQTTRRMKYNGNKSRSKHLESFHEQMDLQFLNVISEFVHSNQLINLTTAANFPPCFYLDSFIRVLPIHTYLCALAFNESDERKLDFFHLKKTSCTTDMFISNEVMLIFMDTDCLIGKSLSFSNLKPCGFIKLKSMNVCIAERFALHCFLI